MECLLRHIQGYPFEPEKENNVVRLAYTCFADHQTAD